MSRFEKRLHEIDRSVAAWLGPEHLLYVDIPGTPCLTDGEFDALSAKFEDKGLEFLYLPVMMRRIPKEVVTYYAPWDQPLPDTDSIRERLADIFGISGPSVITLSDEDVLIERLGGKTIFDYVGRRRAPKYRQRDTSICMMPLSRLEAPDVVEESDTERLVRELASLNEEKLRSIGLSEETLRFILGQNFVVSRMRITRHSEILLEDYDNREIRLDTKTKALYFLYLRHPEGIAIKDLQDHVNELLDLYQSISGRDDPDAMRKTIDDLVSPYGNDINVSLSRIKRAFIDFCPLIAQNYYVVGERGGLRRIILDRDLLTWETIR